MFWILDKLKLTNVKQLAEQEMSLLQVKPGLRDGEVGPNCSQGWCPSGTPQGPWDPPYGKISYTISIPISLGILMGVVWS